MYHAWYMHGTCMKYVCTMHGTCMKYTSVMHGIYLYHARNYAWYTHEDLGKMHAYFRSVPYACPVPVERPNSLHVPVLSHETCMVHRPMS